MKFSIGRTTSGGSEENSLCVEEPDYGQSLNRSVCLFITCYSHMGRYPTKRNRFSSCRNQMKPSVDLNYHWVITKWITNRVLIDGKHIVLINPSNSVSVYFNYKKFQSIVLLALSDADLCFSLVDCDQYGRVSDAGVFKTSVFYNL